MRIEISLHVTQKGGGARSLLGEWFSTRSIKMSMIQVISHSGQGGTAADRTPFYGIKLPPEVKKLVQLSKAVDHATVRKILKCMDIYIVLSVSCCLLYVLCRCCDACRDGRRVRGSANSATGSKVLTRNSQSVVCRNAIIADVSTSYTRT